jgi:uncharacterized protein YodC (DUF2158 family)
MNKDLQLITGDVVQLNSGGPKMTVVSNSNGLIKCQFFDKQDIVYVRDFFEATLKKIDTDDTASMPIFKS